MFQPSKLRQVGDKTTQRRWIRSDRTEEPSGFLKLWLIKAQQGEQNLKN